MMVSKSMGLQRIVCLALVLCNGVSSVPLDAPAVPRDATPTSAPRKQLKGRFLHITGRLNTILADTLSCHPCIAISFDRLFGPTRTCSHLLLRLQIYIPILSTNLTHLQAKKMPVIEGRARLGHSGPRLRTATLLMPS